MSDHAARTGHPVRKTGQASHCPSPWAMACACAHPPASRFHVCRQRFDAPYAVGHGLVGRESGGILRVSGSFGILVRSRSGSIEGEGGG
jgi:hypothetical protein